MAQYASVGKFAKVCLLVPRFRPTYPQHLRCQRIRNGDVEIKRMSRFKEVRIHSLGELVDYTTPRYVDPASGRRRNYAVYRGASETNCGLLTSLDRLGGCDPPHTKAHLEEHILRNFIRYAQPFLHNH